MSDTGNIRPEDILGACQAAAERGDVAAIERACREHPELAEEIWSLVEVVRRLGAHAAEAERISVRRDFVVPERIGRYRVLREIGRGGSSVVWAAEDPQLGRVVALKVLALAPSVESAERFRREARALASLRHPNIAAVHEAGETPDGLSYIAMEHVDGVSFGALLGRFAGRDPAGLGADELPRPEGEERASFVTTMVRWTSQIAAALEHAHSGGVVHRDVKPANILIDRKGSPVLVDFGLARGADSQTVTRTGVAPGTPLYMAPEQVSGGRGAIGSQADVYALGVTLYHALTLRPPFAGETTEQVFEQICHADPVSPRSLNPGVSRDLETVVLTAMEKDPARRYATAKAFREDLEALLASRPIKARPAGRVARLAKWSRRHPAAAAAAAVVVVGVLGSWLLRAWQLRADGKEALASFRSRQLQFARAEPGLAAKAASITGFLPAGERGRIAEDQADADVRRLAMERDLVTAIDCLGASYDETSWLGPLNDGLRYTLCRALIERSAQLAERGNAIDARACIDRARAVASERWQDWTWGHIRLTSAAPGSEAHLFRYEPYELGRRGAIPRLVPVPVGGDGELLPRELAADFQCGDVCLLVTAVTPHGAAARAGVSVGDIIYRVGDDDLRERRLYVASVTAGGLAERHGVRVFDRVERINDAPATGLWAWELVPRHDGEPATIVSSVIRTVSGRETHVSGSVHYPDFRRVPWLSSSIVPTASRLERRLESGVETVEDVLGFRPAELPELLESATHSVVDFQFLHDGRPVVGHCDANEPLGASLDWTSQPLSRDARCRIDLAEGRSLRLAPGSYLALVAAPGRIDVRQPFVVPLSELDDTETVAIALDPPMVGEGPPGFVFVPGGDFLTDGEADVTLPQPRRRSRVGPFWISRHEVSTREWFEYANESSSAKLAVIEEDGDFRAGDLPVPVLGRDGWALIVGDRWVPATNADADAPVVGIDREMLVTRYLTWKNEREAGSGWRYRLPTTAEWELAARGADGRAYPWGDRFDPTLCNSLCARDAATSATCTQEPSERFVWDESPFGVRDMAGGAVEANTGRVADSFPWTPWRGGSWVMASPAYFKAASHVPSRSDLPERGFRLVAERAEN